MDINELLEKDQSLRDELRSDILERYDNIEYWNLDIIEDYRANNNIELD